MTNGPVSLSNRTLADIPAGIARPGYNRDEIKTGIVHIGPSNFFRAHLAVYVDDLLNRGSKEWGICAVSLRTDTTRSELKDQDNLYTVVEQGSTGNTARVIGSVKEILSAQEDPKVVLDRMASPDVKLVTLTVTQAGYYYSNGTLDFEHQDIKADLGKDEPRSTVGFIVAALNRRMRAGLEPFTVMSCDNLPGNGTILRSVVLAYALQTSQELHDWVAQRVSFPDTMVDRIVPRATDSQKAGHAAQFDIVDKSPIYTESFRQFVIKSSGPGKNLPDFESVGAVVADDVMPFELMKIRLLNGIHMALGVIGRQAGYKYDHEAINDPNIRRFMVGLMDEMQDTLLNVPGVNLQEYRASILERLSSTYMADDLARLARNGVDKVDSRFLQPTRDALARGTDCGKLAFAVAAWISYLGKAGRDPSFDIMDKKAFDKGLPQMAGPGVTASSFMAVSRVFGIDLAASHKFTSSVQKALECIGKHQGDMVKALTAYEELPGSKLPAAPVKPSHPQPRV